MTAVDNVPAEPHPADMAKAKAKAARDPLGKRYQIRCSDEDWALWDARARLLGFNGASAWIRKTMNDAIAALPAAERKAIEAYVEANEAGG